VAKPVKPIGRPKGENTCRYRVRCSPEELAALQWYGRQLLVHAIEMHRRHLLEERWEAEAFADN
jgi:hypothetical protein